MQKNNNKLTADAVKFIKAGPAHVPGMVQCHINAFPGRFMTEMGRHWLCALYLFFIKHHGGICLVAVDTGETVVGLAVGGDPNIRDEFLSSAMFRYPHLIFWKFLCKRLVRRVLLKELTRKFHRSRAVDNSGDTKGQKVETRSGNLLSLCVLPDYKGTGIGGKLIESFKLACADEGYKHLTLSVVSENTRALAFYKKHGWRRSGKSGASIKFSLDL
jgi:ribosomal protein S18 acetylase RimI-like enzyme